MSDSLFTMMLKAERVNRFNILLQGGREIHMSSCTLLLCWS